MSVRGGLLAGARLVMAVEDHEAGKQNVRFRTMFSGSRLLPVLAMGATGAAVLAVLAGAWLAACVFGASLAGLAWRTDRDWRAAAGEVATALAALERRGPSFAGGNARRERDYVNAVSPQVTADAAE